MAQKPTFVLPTINGSYNIWGQQLNTCLGQQSTFNTWLETQISTLASAITVLDNDKLEASDIDSIIGPKIDNYISTTGVVAINNHITTVSQPQLDNYVVTLKTNLDDYIVNTSQPSINTYVTTVANVSIDNYVTSTVQGNIDSYVTNTSKVAIKNFTDTEIVRVQAYGVSFKEETVVSSTNIDCKTNYATNIVMAHNIIFNLPMSTLDTDYSNDIIVNVSTNGTYTVDFVGDNDGDNVIYLKGEEPDVSSIGVYTYVCSYNALLNKWVIGWYKNE